MNRKNLRGLGTAALNALILFVLCFAAGAHAKRVALLIGNATYSVGALTNPPNDVAEMERALRNLGFQVQKVLNANQNQMKRAVRDFGTAAQGAEFALLYYSGHGTQVNGENYLLPVGTQIEKESDYAIEAIAANDVLQQLRGANPKAAILVLDACRDNPLAATTKSGARGLSRMNPPTGTMVAFATAPNETASDNGNYARVLAREIQKRGVEIVDVFRNTAAEVRRLSPASKPQDPRLSDVSLHERVYLAGGSAPTPAPVDADQLACDVARSGGGSAWRVYLQEFPNGRCAAVARVAIGGPTPPIAEPPPALSSPRAKEDVELFQAAEQPYSSGQGLVVDASLSRMALVSRGAISVLDTKTGAVLHRMPTSASKESFRNAAFSSSALFATLNRGISEGEAASMSFLAGFTLGLSTVVTGGISSGSVVRVDHRSSERTTLSTSVDGYEIDVQPSGNLLAVSTGYSDLGIGRRVSLLGIDGWSQDSVYLSCDALRWLTDTILFSACARDEASSSKSLVSFAVTRNTPEFESRSSKSIQLAASEFGALGYLGDTIDQLVVHRQRSVIGVASSRYPAVEIWAHGSPDKLRRIARLEARDLLPQALDAGSQPNDSHGISCLAWTSDGSALFISAWLRTGSGVRSVSGLWSVSSRSMKYIATVGAPDNCATGPDETILYTVGKSVRRIAL